jgi:serine/threonine protein kinase
VQLTARLTHPNTISIYDYGRTPDGTFYYAMELLEGLTVEQLCERHGPQPIERVIHLLIQACGALSEAHQSGLIHRDIKPANLYLCRRRGQGDVVKVLDFGLVRELRQDAEVSRSAVDTVVGTPLYLSPEAILTPDRIDARADLYGLGAVAYFMLTGSAPFGGRTLVEICSHHLHTPPEPLSPRRAAARASREVPSDLERLVLHCLAKEPDARPPSAAALAESLLACEDAVRWKPADAERWWATHEPEPERRPMLDESGVEQRLTVCAVDLKQRLAVRKESA